MRDGRVVSDTPVAHRSIAEAEMQRIHEAEAAAKLIA